MKSLSNWNEISKGFYRYVISAGACYEIHIINWWENTDILTSNAKLYIVGTWNEQDTTHFEREQLFEGALFECLECAVKDDKENNK
jgi:hypothetical protein